MNIKPRLLTLASLVMLLALSFASCTTESIETSLSYSPSSVSVASTGGTLEIALSTAIGYSMSVLGDWLTLMSVGDLSENVTVTLGGGGRSRG